MEAPGQRLHAHPEDAGYFVELQPKEIFHLGAGDEDGDAIGETDDHGPGNVLHGGTHACDAHDHEH